MKFLTGLMALVATVGLAVGAQAAPLVINDFGFKMGAPNAAEGGTDDSVNKVVNMQLMENVYQGSSAGGIVSFDFGFFGPVQGYTDDVPVVAPAPTWAVAGGHVTAIDLSSWTAFWNANTFNQGPNGGVVTITPVGATDTLIWLSTISGGSFNGQTGHWWANVTVVPEPMSIALVGSSLIGLIGLRRRLMA